MLGDTDPVDIAKNQSEYARLVVNADFTREFGALHKCFGFDFHEIMDTMPQDMPPILSLGWMTYVQVWAGDLEVNKKMGRLIVQTDGHPQGTVNTLDYYYIEYDFEAGAWNDWEGPFSQENVFGTTKADRIRWTPFNNVMRGACGNESDSNPLWIGYVNRKKEDDNGYFHHYEWGDQYDADGFSDIEISQSLPITKIGLTHVDTYDNDASIYHNIIINVIAVPVYDGHQICSLEQVAYPSGFDAKFLRISSADEQRVNFKIKCSVAWKDIGGILQVSRRLTGVNIYVSEANFESIGETQGDFQFLNWKLIKYLDIREGNQLPIRGYNGIYTHPVGAFGYLKTTDSGMVDDLYNNLWVCCRSTDSVVEYYKITDMYYDTGFMIFKLDMPSGSPYMLNNSEYQFFIMEKWDMGAINVYDCDIVLWGDEIDLEIIPSWLPDPNRLLDDTYDPPVISCNYKHSVEFEGRHFVGDIYHDGEKKPLQARYSNPVNDPFAGHDLYPNYINVPSDKGDKIMGFAKSIVAYPDRAKHVLTIFTERKLFRYIFDSGQPVLQETTYHIGLMSNDSIETINGIHYFAGQKGKYRSIYRYDGHREPKDILSGRMRTEFETALLKDGVVSELILGWYDKLVDQYRFSVNAYES